MAKTRVSISIEKNLLKNLDREVDGKSASSRSEAIEQIIGKYIDKRKICVILAGGDPNKLFMEDLKIYRSLAPVHEKTLIEYQILEAKKAGYNQVFIIAQKKVISAIYEKIGDGKSLNIGIDYLEEKETLGSAQSLAVAKEKIKGPFLLIPTDHYFSELDIKDLEEYHRINHGIATLIVYSGSQNPWPYSSIVELEGNKIVAFEEKPKNVKTYLTSLTIGIIEPEIFDYIPSGKVNWSLQENVFENLAKKKKLFGYIYSRNWRNIHSKKDLRGLS